MSLEKRIQQGYDYAKEVYAAWGVDVEEAIAQADAVPLSLHCWQGDGGYPHGQQPVSRQKEAEPARQLRR